MWFWLNAVGELKATSKNRLSNITMVVDSWVVEASHLWPDKATFSLLYNHFIVFVAKGATMKTLHFLE